MLVRMMEDTEVPFGVRAKIAQDLLDRAGLNRDAGPPDHSDDGGPDHAVLRGCLQRPEQLGGQNPLTASHREASDRSPGPRRRAVVEAEIVEPEGEPANHPPPRVAEMIKAAPSTASRGSDQ